MKSKTTGLLIAVIIALSLCVSNGGVTRQGLISANSIVEKKNGSSANQIPKPAPSKAEQLADRIIVGLVSEKQFSKLNLTSEEVLEVFKHIRDKRGWTIPDEGLESALRLYKFGESIPEPPASGSISPQASGPCNYFLGLENGSTYASYPLYQTSPNSGECGPDSDDVVLVYNTPKWPNTNSYNVRVYSSLWWVRSAISGCYGGVSANSLCTSTTRVCIGSCARWLGSDLNYLYLWHK